MPANEEPEDQPPRGIAVLAVMFGLTGFAIAQPLLSLAGANPTLFVFNQLSRTQIVGLALAIVFLPPLVGWMVIVVLGRIRPGFGTWAYRVIAALLALLAGIWMGRDAGLGIASVGFGLLISAAAVWAIASGTTAAQWLRYTAILPFLALGLFLFSSESSALLRTEDQADRNQIAGASPSLVFLVLDELPTMSLLADDGTIDALRFPNFARLAAESTWFPNYSAHSRTTETAVPTMLSGQVPRLESPLWTNYPDTLFSLLAPTHGLTVHESFTKLCGVSTCGTAGPDQRENTADSDLGATADQLVDLWIDRMRGAVRTVDELADFEEATEAPTVDFDAPGFFPTDDYIRQWPTRFTNFVDALVPGNDPSLYYLHLLLPHSPWQWYPDGQLYSAPPNPIRYVQLTSQTQWITALDQHRHLLQLQYVDNLLGELFTTLEQREMYDDVALIVVADHGAAFEVGLTRRSMEDGGRTGTAFVPLFVKQPGQRDGAVNEANVMAVDLLPLVADLLGVDVPWTVDGFAPDAPEVASRGDEKFYYSLTGSFTPTAISGPIPFDGGAERPSAADRLIRSARPGDAELDALTDRLTSSALIGRSLSDLGADPGGRVDIWAFDSILDDGATAAPFVQGTLAGATSAVEVLVAADGVVVSGSPVFETDDGAGFIAMLPSSLVGQGPVLDIVLVEADGSLTVAAVESL